VRIAIMGSGFIALTHAHALRHGCTNALLAGIGGGSRAPHLAADFAVPCFPSIDELAADPAIDAVVIATPHQHHREHALLCAQHGKHVLLEKPMATSVAACQEIIQAFQSAHRCLMIAFTQRFRQSNITAYDHTRAGHLGRVLMVTETALLPNGLAAYPGWQQQTGNLGILFGYGIHNIDRLRWFLQDEAESVSTHVLRSTGGIETSTMATVQWKSGALASIWSNVDLPAPGFDASVFRSLIVGDNGLPDVDGYGAVRFSGKNGSWQTLFVPPKFDTIQLKLVLIALAMSLIFPVRMVNAQDEVHSAKSLSEAVTWLEKGAHRIIVASRRTMNDGTSAFPPQVGIGYEAFWLRDYV
jgi:predicted dehydrogenase